MLQPQHFESDFKVFQMPTGCGARIPPQSSPTNVVAKLRFTQRCSWLTLPDVLAFLVRTSEDDITQSYDSDAGNLETHWLASKGFFLAVLGKIDNIFLQEHKHYYFYWLSNANKILVLNAASLLQEKESLFSTACSSVVELSPSWWLKAPTYEHACCSSTNRWGEIYFLSLLIPSDFDLGWPTHCGKSDTGSDMSLAFKKSVSFHLGSSPSPCSHCPWKKLRLS